MSDPVVVGRVIPAIGDVRRNIAERSIEQRKAAAFDWLEQNPEMWLGRAVGGRWFVYGAATELGIGDTRLEAIEAAMKVKP